MHKQVFLSREATTALDFPVAPLAGAPASAAIESIIAVETSFGRAVVANRIPAGEAETWARGLRHVANDHRYYELTHESLNHQFEHYYLLLQDRTKTTRAIQPFLIVEQDLATGLPGPIRRGLQKVRGKFPGSLHMRMLMVGCSAGEGHLVRDRVTGTEAWVAQALGEALQPVARALKARLIVFKDFPKSYRTAFSKLNGHGYTRVPSMPGSSLDLKPFGTFEEYLTKLLSKKTRKNLRLKYKQAAAGTKTEMQVVNDVAPYIDEVFPLYQQVVRRSRYKFEELTKSYFLNLGRTMNDRTVFFIWRQNGRAVAFSSCVVHEGVLRDHYIGLDYAVALDSHLYFVTWRDIFTWALENGCHSYYSAPLNYEPKYHLRHDLVPLDLYVRTVSDWLNPLFGRLIPYLEPTRYDPMIRRFANAHELW
jgi:hypothetical protein